MAYSVYGTLKANIDGAWMSTRGDFTIRGGDELEVTSNNDGTLHSTIKPMPAEAELTFSADGFDLKGFMSPEEKTVILELANGDLYTFTDARVSGRPELNGANGEVSGVTINSANMKVIRNPGAA